MIILGGGSIAVFNTNMLNTRHHPKRLSKTLEDNKTALTSEHVSLDNLLALFGDRGTAFILFLVALPAALPVPAIGIFLLIGPPLIFLTAQQMLGRNVIWLPNWLKNKTFQTCALKDVISKAIPLTQKIEALSKPRLSLLTSKAAQTIIGLMGFIMALSVLVPIPLTNTVPSMGIALMALGTLMRDGLAVIVGAIIGLSWVLMLVTLTFYFGTETIDVVKEFIKTRI